MITTVQQAWNEALSELGRRTAGVTRVQNYEILEWVNRWMLLLAGEIPPKMLAEFRGHVTWYPGLTGFSVPYPNTRGFKLLDTILYAISVSIKKGSDVYDIEFFEDVETFKRYVAADNYYYKPLDTRPWGVEDGRVIIVAPAEALDVEIAPGASVIVDACKVPTQASTMSSGITELAAELRPCLPLLLAFEAMNTKLGMKSEAKDKFGEFAMLYEQQTGMPWKIIPKDDYEPMPQHGAKQ